MTSDPGICTGQESSSAQAGGPLNDRIEIPPDYGRKTRKRPEADPATRELGRWKGQAPEEWSRQRSEQVRAASRHRKRLRDAAKAGAPVSARDYVTGPKLLELARAVPEPRAYPYPLVQRKRRVVEQPIMRPEQAWKLRDVHLRALGWIVAGHLAIKGSQGLLISHETMGELLGLKKRQTGKIMRQLVTWCLVESTPWFRADGPLLWRESSLYTVTATAIAFFDIRPRRSKKRAPEVDLPRGTGVPLKTICEADPFRKVRAVGEAPTESTSGADAGETSVPSSARLGRPVSLLATKEKEQGSSRKPSTFPAAELRVAEAVAAASAAAVFAAEAPLRAAQRKIDELMREKGYLEMDLEKIRRRRYEQRTPDEAEAHRESLREERRREQASDELEGDWVPDEPLIAAPAPIAAAPGGESLEDYRKRMQREREEFARVPVPSAQRKVVVEDCDLADTIAETWRNNPRYRVDVENGTVGRELSILRRRNDGGNS